MRSSMRLPLLLFCLALLLWGAYALIGARVDEDGWLREPFFLIPLGWLCLFASVSLAFGRLVGRLRGRSRRTSKR